ncbi:hypothetical protein QJS10_CPA03g00530 [Acorus calamus]|uniref:Zinc transporter 5 n=1 Tax=Acorus calamus TaxID=4465 RepID=A0AAV9F7W0_ACOCL|nr:hypothetical protein QJS10_CPA03g00530 [Acorus calamus]
MMSSKPLSADRNSRSTSLRQTPLQIIHVIGNFMRIWSIYSLYQHLSQQGDSVVIFIFSCMVPASILFLVLQTPWKGRPLTNSQVVPSVINGGIMALYYVLWGKGLKSCGPLRIILAEYAGAVLGVLSVLLYGRRGHIWKKVGGLVAMLVSFYFLSLGWATRTYFPISSIKDNANNEEMDLMGEPLGMGEMAVPIAAGILSALRRVIARRVSLKNQQKRRLHAITITSATCFLFPLAMWDAIFGSASGIIIAFQFPTWAYLSTILFGIIFIFYIDNIAEERLHLVFSSPRHLMVAGGCIIVMEFMYKTDFSLPGFLICSSVLGFGIYEATSLERIKKDAPQPQDVSDGIFDNQMPTSLLPS